MYKYAGRILKSYGAGGELLIAPSGNAEWNAEQAFFVRIDELWTPFFLKNVKEQAAKKIVVFENMESEHLAQTLAGKELYVEDSKPSPQTQQQRCEYEGYKVFNNTEIIGRVSRFFDFNGNICFEIKNDADAGAVALIPAHPDFIVKICKKQKHLYMHLPEGIMEL